MTSQDENQGIPSNQYPQSGQPQYPQPQPQYPQNVQQGQPQYSQPTAAQYPQPQQPDYFQTQQPQSPPNVNYPYLPKKPANGGSKKLILIILILILAIGGIAAYQLLREKKIVLGQCIALATNDLSYCAAPPGANCSDTNNSNPCAVHRECCVIDECKTGVFLSGALKTSNPSSCDEINPEFDSDRIFCQAVTKKDISTCAEINNTADRIGCEAVISKDAGLCNALKGAYENDPPGASSEVQCLDWYYSALAVINKDTSYCKKIKGLMKIEGAGPHNLDESYLKCMADVSHNVKYCNVGNLCFGSQKSIIKCLYGKVENEQRGEQGVGEKELKESLGFNKTEWDYYKKELRYNKTEWEKYKQAHNNPPWWMFW